MKGMAETLRRFLETGDMDKAAAVHVGIAIEHLSLAEEIQDAVDNSDFAELLDAVHKEAGIDSKGGRELGGGG